MTRSVAVLKISVSDFFKLEPVQVIDLFETELEYKKHEIKEQHFLQFIATFNAIGKMFSKQYKYIDAFEKKEVKKKELNEDEIDELRSVSKKMR